MPSPGSKCQNWVELDTQLVPKEFLLVMWRENLYPHIGIWSQDTISMQRFFFFKQDTKSTSYEIKVRILFLKKHFEREKRKPQSIRGVQDI